MQPWRVESSQVVVDNPFLHVRADRCVRADGHVIDPYFVAESDDWVCVVGLTEAGRVVLVEEYRHGAGAVLLGLPGGRTEPGEDPAGAARREFAEETGYTVAELIPVGSLWTNPAKQNNRMHVFVALGCAPGGAQQLDANEEIAVREVSWSEATRPQTIDQALYVAALALAERRLTADGLRPA